MKLTTKFNVVLLSIGLVSLLATAAVADRVLNETARAAALQNARIMLEAAMAARSYTNTNVVKLLETQMKYTFLSESVPSFAASEVLNLLRQQLPEYAYKEALLNPTNPRDRVTDWESDVVHEFRNDAQRGEIIGERDTPTGRMLYLARPIRINDGNCLACHHTPESAPPTLIERYGPSNGFGWKLHETVGAQIITVPVVRHLERAHATLIIFMGAIAALFVAVFIVLNVMLRLLVIRPITRLSAIAEQVSLGEDDVPAFPDGGADEIGALGRAFTRMRTSLQKAITLLDQ